MKWQLANVRSVNSGQQQRKNLQLLPSKNRLARNMHARLTRSCMTCTKMIFMQEMKNLALIMICKKSCKNIFLRDLIKICKKLSCSLCLQDQCKIFIPCKQLKVQVLQDLMQELVASAKSCKKNTCMMQPYFLIARWFLLGYFSYRKDIWSCMGRTVASYIMSGRRVAISQENVSIRTHFKGQLVQAVTVIIQLAISVLPC